MSHAIHIWNQSTFEFLRLPFSKTAHWARRIDGKRDTSAVESIDPWASLRTTWQQQEVPLLLLSSVVCDEQPAAQSVCHWKLLRLKLVRILPNICKLQNKLQRQDSGMHKNALLYLIEKRLWFMDTVGSNTQIVNFLVTSPSRKWGINTLVSDGKSCLK